MILRIKFSGPLIILIESDESQESHFTTKRVRIFDLESQPEKQYNDLAIIFSLCRRKESDINIINSHGNVIKEEEGKDLEVHLFHTFQVTPLR